MGRAPQTGLALVSRDVFNRLAKYQSIHECWIDFTLWAACQAGEQDIHQRALQGQLLARYPSGTKQLFLAVLRELQAVIAANPRQNAMLQIMIALGLEDHVVASYGLDNEVKDEWKEGFARMNYQEDVFAPDRETVTLLQPDMILS